MIRTHFGLPINVGLNIETPTTRHDRKYIIYKIQLRIYKNIQLRR